MSKIDRINGQKPTGYEGLFEKLDSVEYKGNSFKFHTDTIEEKTGKFLWWKYTDVTRDYNVEIKTDAEIREALKNKQPVRIQERRFFKIKAKDGEMSNEPTNSFCVTLKTIEDYEDWLVCEDASKKPQNAVQHLGQWLNSLEQSDKGYSFYDSSVTQEDSTVGFGLLGGLPKYYANYGRLSPYAAAVKALQSDFNQPLVIARIFQPVPENRDQYYHEGDSDAIVVEIKHQDQLVEFLSDLADEFPPPTLTNFDLSGD